MSYLPFAKPTLDEETIAGVVEVLRSGWITSGPKVQEFERALSDYLGGRIVRTFPELVDAIRRHDFAADKVAAFAARHFSHLDGASTDRVIDKVILAR